MTNVTNIMEEKMRNRFLKKVQINFSNPDTEHKLAYEVFSSGETFGRIKNMTHDLELFGEDRDAAVRLLNKFYFPETDPQGDYDDVKFTDLNPDVIVTFG